MKHYILPNRDVWQVRDEKEDAEYRKTIPHLRTKGEMMANTSVCPEPNCRLVFPSLELRDQHIATVHMGLNSELQSVQLPDGTRVPVALLAEEYLKSQQKQVEDQALADALNASK